MSTISTLNKIKRRLNYLLGKKEMLKIVFEDLPTKENHSKFEAISNELDNELDKYYSNVVMFLKEQDKALFEVYLELPKESVKKTLLLKISQELKEKKKNEPSIDYYKFNIHTELKK